MTIATSLLKTPEPILAVSGLRKVFGELVAVDDVSFGLPAGGSMAIVGESGSGKTTIAKPWNLDFSPGGSSGGSGASLAAGTTTLATGSDIGGSIRSPSHEGSLARTIEDCLLLENAIAGPHPSDVASLRPKLELPFPLPPIEGMRIAAMGARGDQPRPRINYGLISGAWIGAFAAEHADELCSYTLQMAKESAEITKEQFVEGVELEGGSTNRSASCSSGTTRSSAPPSPSQRSRPSGPTTDRSRSATARSRTRSMR